MKQTLDTQSMLALLSTLILIDSFLLDVLLRKVKFIDTKY
jgi:hypothetical protein